MFKLLSRITLHVILFNCVEIGFASSKNISDSSGGFTKHAVFLEAAGNSITSLSLNYEYFVLSKFNSILSINTSLGARVGWGLNLSGIDEAPVFVFPFMLDILFGKTHKLELGAGAVYHGEAYHKYDSQGQVTSFREINFTNAAFKGILTVGYRYQEQTGGLEFRIGYTPFFSLNKFLISRGFSIGYAWGAANNNQVEESIEDVPIRNMWYFEQWGNGGYGQTFNYEYVPFIIGESQMISLRVGLGIDALPEDDTYSLPWLTIPLTVNLLLGNKNSLEIGGGAFLYARRNNREYKGVFDPAVGAKGTLTLGYRYKKNDGSVYKIGITPFFDAKQFVFNIGLGIGYAW